MGQAHKQELTSELTAFIVLEGFCGNVMLNARQMCWNFRIVLCLKKDVEELQRSRSIDTSCLIYCSLVCITMGKCRKVWDSYLYVFYTAWIQLSIIYSMQSSKQLLGHYHPCLGHQLSSSQTESQGPRTQKRPLPEIAQTTWAATREATGSATMIVSGHGT